MKYAEVPNGGEQILARNTSDRGADQCAVVFPSSVHLAKDR